jgi:oxygen-independent coproporphyrinogen-3 oxidase
VQISELPFEFMMNQLRLHKSFTLLDYQKTTGLSPETVLPYLKKAEQKKLMVNCQQSQDLSADTWHVTELGHKYLNDLLEMFL